MLSKPVVIVAWQDAVGCSAGWEEVDDSQASKHMCYSVGYLWDVNEYAILLLPHMSPQNDEAGTVNQACGDMSIPISAIHEIKVVQRTKDGVDLLTSLLGKE